MTLQDDLKAKALSLISQQMANWVVDIQRQIGEHQGNLVRALDDLQESVARYDEKINEGDIEMAMAEVVANIPPPEPMIAAGPGFDQLKASVVALEKGTSLSEVLTHLVNEVSQYVDRTAMFIVKGPSAIGWYACGVRARGRDKQVNVPLTPTPGPQREQLAPRHARLHGAFAGDPTGAGQARRQPQAVKLAVPLILRDKLAAIPLLRHLDGGSAAARRRPRRGPRALAGKTIDMLARAQGRGRPACPGRPPLLRGLRPPALGPPPLRRTPTPGRGRLHCDVQRAADERAAARRGAAPRAAAPPPPPAAHAPAMSPEETKAHEDAKRFARLVVSEIKLYNEAKVNEGRRNKDIYERLKEDIERGRQMYADRVAPHVRDSTNYFYDELVRILAGGDQGALGPM
jgi:hypothetical protein